MLSAFIRKEERYRMKQAIFHFMKRKKKSKIMKRKKKAKISRQKNILKTFTEIKEIEKK